MPSSCLQAETSIGPPLVSPVLVLSDPPKPSPAPSEASELPGLSKAPEPSPRPSAGSHVTCLDGLRGIAILGVLWYHAWVVSGVASTLHVAGHTFDFQPIAATGFLGVDLFFFVSGFCLFYPYARHLIEGKSMPTIGEFWVRRAEKILPSYLVALAVFAVLHRSWFPSSSAWLSNLAAHLSFLHPLFFTTFGSISGPFWTLGIEVQFYTLFPIVCWFFRRQPWLMFAVLVLIANAYRFGIAVAGDNTLLYPTSQLPAVIDLFGAGMLSAYAIVALQKRFTSWRARLAATAIALASAVAVGFLLMGLSSVAQHGSSGDQYVWVNAHRGALAVLFGLCAVGSTLALPFWRVIMSHRLLLFLAAISYNLYLWHLEIIVWYQSTLAPTLTRYIHTQGISMLIVPSILAVAFAAIATRWIERPFLKGAWRSKMANLIARMKRMRASRQAPEWANASGLSTQSADA